VELALLPEGSAIEDMLAFDAANNHFVAPVDGFEVWPPPFST